jgi:hypothetical protein
MSNSGKKFLDVGAVFALGLIVFGFLQILDLLKFNLSFKPLDFWPLIIIAVGLGHLIQAGEKRRFWTGLYITAVGCLFQASKLGLISGLELRLKNIWPFLMVLLGVMLLERHFCGSGRIEPGDSDYIRHTAILGGGDYRYSSKNLKGGEITAILGGCSLDLRNADMAGDEMLLDTFAAMGGIEIRVPDHWIVQVMGTPILGGMENKAGREWNTNSEENQKPRKKLLVKGTAIMGGVEIK